MFRVIRDFDTIKCYTSEVNGNIKSSTKITYTLPTDKGSLTDEAFANIAKMLSESSPVGFGILSQPGSFRIQDQSGIFEDPKIYYVPKDEILQKIDNTWTNVGKISRNFEDRTLVYNDITGKLFWIQNGKVTILADKHSEKTTIGNLDHRISTIETQLGESTTRFSVVRELPENPDPNVLYMIVGESDVTDSGVSELNLTELRDSIK